MQLDIPTLMSVFAIIDILLAIILFFFYQNYQKISGGNYILFALVVQSLASIFSMMRRPEQLQMNCYLMLFGNSFYLFSQAFYFQAMRLFVGQKTTWLLPMSFIAVLMCYFALFSSSDYIHYRIVVSSSGIALFSIISFWVLSQSNYKDSLGITILKWTFFITTLACMLRVFRRLYQGLEGDFYLHFINNSTIFVWGITSSVLIVIGTVVLTIELYKMKLEKQLEELKSTNEKQIQHIRQYEHVSQRNIADLTASTRKIKNAIDKLLVINYGSRAHVEFGLRRINEHVSELDSLLNKLPETKFEKTN